MSKGFSVSILLIALVLVTLVLIPLRAGQPYHPPCIGNMKQTALGLVMYASDYDDRLPKAAKWMADIEPYTKGQYLRCGLLKEGEYGIAMNRFLSGVNTATQPDQDKQPMIYECSDLAKNVSEYLPQFAFERHPGIINLAYLDGQAKTIRVQPAQ
ncbi:MAG TPA: hypothetical protein VK934_03380 [Fimbriimonas sp.]|nr:hypothetical protein [Fimbriimonas sp.]